MATVERLHADRIVTCGQCHGRCLLLTEPLGFWGGLRAATGEIIDRHHPQCGESVAGRVLFMQKTRGSTSATAVLVEALRLGNGPAGIVLGEADTTVMVAVLTADELYNCGIPVIILDRRRWPALGSQTDIRIDGGVLIAV